PRCKYRHEDERTFDLLGVANAFLEDRDKKVLLLIGNAGAGKSTFTRQFTYILWQKYRAEGNIIPLFISLPTMKDPVRNLIPEYLKQKGGFSEDETKVLKNSRRFVFILDGFDEMAKRDQNLY